MIRKVLYILMALLVLLCSCGIVKNDFGQTRTSHKRFTIKPNKLGGNITIKIDTTAFYLKIAENDNRCKYDIKNQKKEIKGFGTGIKFYSRGRVALFHNFDINNKETLDPRKAIMGYYNEINGELFIEFLYSHVQSGNYLVKSKVIEIKEDLLKVYSYQKALSSAHSITYNKIKLPKEFLIYQPDWQ